MAHIRWQCVKTGLKSVAIAVCQYPVYWVSVECLREAWLQRFCLCSAHTTHEAIDAQISAVTPWVGVWGVFLQGKPAQWYETQEPRDTPSKREDLLACIWTESDCTTLTSSGYFSSEVQLLSATGQANCCCCKTEQGEVGIPYASSAQSLALSSCAEQHYKKFSSLKGCFRQGNGWSSFPWGISISLDMNFHLANGIKYQREG